MSLQEQRESSAEARAHARVLEQRMADVQNDIEDRRAAAAAAQENFDRAQSRCAAAESELAEQRRLVRSTQERAVAAEERCRSVPPGLSGNQSSTPLMQPTPLYSSLPAGGKGLGPLYNQGGLIHGNR